MAVEHLGSTQVSADAPGAGGADTRAVTATHPSSAQATADAPGAGGGGDASTSSRPSSAQLAALGVVTGAPLFWLRLEGFAALVAGIGLFLQLGGWPIAVIPLILAVDLSMAGYFAGPRPGAVIYNLFHNWAVGVAVLVAAWLLASVAVGLAGAVLVAHTGMDRAAGYGLKYPTAFADTHLGRLGKKG